MKKFQTLVKTQLVEPHNQNGEALLSEGDVKENRMFTISGKVLTNGKTTITDADILPFDTDSHASDWYVFKASLVGVNDTYPIIVETTISGNDLIVKFGENSDDFIEESSGQPMSGSITLIHSSFKGIK